MGVGGWGQGGCSYNPSLSAISPPSDYELPPPERVFVCVCVFVTVQKSPKNSFLVLGLGVRLRNNIETGITFTVRGFQRKRSEIRCF